MNSSKDKVATEDKEAPKVISGKVIRVNEKEKTFVLVVGGKESTFSAQKMKTLPRVGTDVELKANHVMWGFGSCEECNAACNGPCFMHGLDKCWCYGTPKLVQTH